jgi:hypothetical protein
MCVEPTEIPQQKHRLGIWAVMTRLNNRYGANVWSNPLETVLEICGKDISRFASLIWKTLTWKSRVIYDRRRLGCVTTPQRLPWRQPRETHAVSRRG